MSIEIRVFLFAGLVPGAVVSLGLLAAWKIWFRRGRLDRPGATGPTWLAPILILIAFVSADYAVKGYPKLWTGNAVYRYPHAVALFVLLGFVESIVELPVWLRAACRFAAIVGAGFILGWPYVASEAVELHQFIGWVCAAGFLGAWTMNSVERSAESLRGPALPMALLPTAAAIPACCFLFGSAYAAQSGAVLIAILVAWGIVGAIIPQIRFDRGGVTAIVGVMLALLIGTGFHHDPRSVVSLALAGAASGFVSITTVSFMRDRPAWLRVLVAIGASLIPIAAALAAGAMARPVTMYDPYAIAQPCTADVELGAWSVNSSSRLPVRA